MTGNVANGTAAAVVPPLDVLEHIGRARPRRTWAGRADRHP